MPRRRTSPHPHHRSAARTLGALVASVIIAASTVVGVPAAGAVGPQPLMFGYVPLPGNEFQAVMEAVNPAATTDLDFTVGITNAADGAVVYYDHWEDGFEADLANPVQATTLVWGDGSAGNGDASVACQTDCGADLLTAGDVFVLRNSFSVPRDAGTVVYDGRDKVASTRGFSLTAGGFSSLGSVLAGSASAFDTSKWGTQYVVPVGEDTGAPSGSSPAFETTTVVVMARRAGTVVRFDTNGDGTVDVTSTIGEGEVATATDVVEGATVSATEPVQVHLGTGDVGSTYESRWFTLFPTPLLSSDYLNPVGSSNDNQRTITYLHNPGSSTITVTPTCTSCAGTFTVAGGETESYPSPLGEAVRFDAAGAPFTAVGAAGAQSGAAPGSGSDLSSSYDWGFSLVPTGLLTTQVVLSWAPGNSANPPSSASAGNYDDDPVWVTTLAPTTVRVDLDGDPTTGALASADCFGARHDLEYVVAALESTRIHDAGDGDMTGSRIYTCDGTKISGAWGEDPASAPTGSPGFDAGYALIPSTNMVLDKTFATVTDVAGDGDVGPGDTLEFTIALSDVGTLAFTNLVVTDIMSAGLSYVAGTTTVDDGSGPVTVADDVAPPAASAFPLDGTGLALASPSSGGTVTLRYRAVVDASLLAPGVTSVTNTVAADSDEEDGGDVIEVQLTEADVSLTKTQLSFPTYVGEPVAFRLEVANAGPDAAAGVEVTDLLPAGMTYVSHTASQGSYDHTTGVWQVGSVASGAVAQMDVTATMEATTAENFAQVTSSGAVDPDSQPGENPLGGTDAPDQDDEDSVRVDVADRADVSVTKTETLSPEVVGEQAGFTVTVANAGAGDTSGVEVTDLLPAGLAYVSHSTATGSYDHTTGVWQVGSLASGTSAELDVIATVTTASPVTNTAELTASDAPDPDSTPGNAVAEDDRDSVVVDVALPSTVGDRVWVDTDGDGVQDAGEPGLGGVGVELRRDTDTNGSYETVAGTATTSGTGSYGFSSVAPGAYQVVATTPPGQTATTAATVTLTVAEGSSHLEADFGFAAPGAVVAGGIGDLVWDDTDADGVQDPGEPGVGGVAVDLGADADGDAVADTAVSRTFTAPDGSYAFSNLPAGRYTVAVEVPAGLAATTPTVLVAEVSPGTSLDTADFGVSGTAPAPGEVGDLVWDDTDGDGSADVGEGGLGGVGVALRGDPDADGSFDAVVATTSSDAAGAYRFAAVPPGAYQVVFTVPVGRHATTPAVVPVTVAPGSVADADWGSDTAPAAAATVGDRVWSDTDGDGAQDAGEPGVNEVGVELRSDIDGDGAFETTAATTTTAGDGGYVFSSVPPGRYLVDVEVPAGLAASSVEPMVRTVAAGGSVSDADVGLVAEGVQPFDLMLGVAVDGAHQVGGTATWTVEVAQGGFTPSGSRPTMTATLPDGTRYESASGEGWQCSGEARLVSCTADAAMSPGDEASLTVQARITAVPQDPDLVAEVSAAGTEITLVNNADAAPVTVTEAPVPASGPGAAPAGGTGGTGRGTGTGAGGAGALARTGGSLTLALLGVLLAASGAWLSRRRRAS